MKLLTNPIVLRMMVVLFGAAFAYLLGMLIIRRMRRSLVEERAVEEATVSQGSFPLHTYHAVIQQLKQQKHELQTMQQAERRRARTSENISAVILANLSSGVLFFTPNGLIRQANPAAKRILGFASPLGMNAAEVFRGARVRPAGQAGESLAEAVEESLREKTACRRMQAEYETPNGEERLLDVTLTSVRAASGEVIGGACLITDQTEIAEIRREQELRGEMSAEMALGLRNSLATIAGSAQQLAASRDPEVARQIASDIAGEAAHLYRTIGGFLAEARSKAATQV